MLMLFMGDQALARDTAARIRDIKVTGAERISRETIISQIELKRGESFDAAKADRSIRALFATEQYKDVRITQRDGVVSVAVVENATVATITYSGNSEVKSDKFKDVVKLKEGGVYSEAKAHADALALREFYRREGRLSSVIEAKTEIKAGNKADVRFNIAEGKVDKVTNITFEGNAAFTAGELEGVIRTVRSSWLDIFKSDSIYVADRLELDRDLLRRHYLTHGFAEAVIKSADGTLDDDGRGYSVRFIIDEGERFAIGDVTFDAGIEGVDVTAFEPLLQVRSGDVYNAAKIDKSVEAVALALYEGPHKYARVAAKLKRDAANKRMGVVFKIEDGPHITVERIEVAGNTKTHLDVILREMKLREGEAFNVLMLERDKARIKALGYFKTVEVKAKAGTGSEDVLIVVAVEEIDTLVLSFGGGYSTTDGVIGDVAIEDRNIFGTGRHVKLKLSGSLVKLQAEASFTEPHLLGTNVAGGFDLFYRDYDASRQSSYKSQKIGGALRAGYALSENVTGSVNYTFAQNKLYDVGATASAAIKEATGGGSSNTYYTSSVGYGLAYDTRDNRKLPTSGSSFVLAQDFAGPGGDVRYIKSTIDARTYYKAAENITLVGRATAGSITGWGGQDVRLLDMYYLGNETVRGFATAGIGPRDTFSTNRDALGGTNYISTTAEARFGLPLIPDEIGLRGAIFADAGSLFGTSAAAAKLPGIAGANAALRASVGAGLIWDSPIGPLRADYAFPLAKQPFDKVQPWSLGMSGF